MLIGIVFIALVLVYVIYYQKTRRQIEEKQKQNVLEDKRKKQEIVRENFKKIFPEVDDKFSNLLNTIGKDEKMSIYRTEASKTFNELLRVFLNFIEADKRLDNLDRLRKNLLPSINDTKESNDRTKESIEKSKELIERINKESNELKKYMENAKEEIKATGLDFINTATEIELAKSSGKLIELSKLKARSKNLEYLTTHIPASSN